MSDLSIVEVTLRECPLCGANVAKLSVTRAGANEWWEVECDGDTEEGCGIAIGRQTKDAVVGKWNTRASAASEAERVREACAKVAESHAAPKGVPQIDYDQACHDIAAAIRSLPIGGA